MQQLQLRKMPTPGPQTVQAGCDEQREQQMPALAGVPPSEKP